MANTTGIEWTDATFNPWRGCSKVSEGCRNCYAEAGSRRNPAVLGVWGPEGTRVVAAESYWREPLKWDRNARDAGERRRVFCASLADWLEDWHGPVEDSRGVQLWVRGDGSWTTSDHYRDTVALTLTHVRARLLSLVAATPHLDWLLLSKRIDGWSDRLHEVVRSTHDGTGVFASAWLDGDAPANVWLGVSVEDQQRADERIPLLRETPAAIRFLSCEPLLSRVNLACPKCAPAWGCPDPVDWFDCMSSRGIGWVIVGGESGHGARPCAVEWVRSLVAQCHAAGIPCFVKQLGARPVTDASPNPNRARGVGPYDAEEGEFPRCWRCGHYDFGPCGDGTLLCNGCDAAWDRLRDPKGGDPSEWPADLRVRQWPA